MSRVSTTIENALGLNTTKASLYLTSPDQLMLHPELAMVAFSVRHAWKILKLDGVLIIDNQPAAYLKQSATAFQKARIEDWIRFLWNHGTAPLLILIEPTNIAVHSSMTRPPSQEGKPWSELSIVESWSIVAEALEQNSLSEYLRRIETGEIYRAYSDKFNTENAVDRCLMENLHHLRNQLSCPQPTRENSFHQFPLRPEVPYPTALSRKDIQPERLLRHLSRKGADRNQNTLRRTFLQAPG
jgi:hypothetical protein